MALVKNPGGSLSALQKQGLGPSFISGDLLNPGSGGRKPWSLSELILHSLPAKL